MLFLAPPIAQWSLLITFVDNQYIYETDNIWNTNSTFKSLCPNVRYAVFLICVIEHLSKEKEEGGGNSLFEFLKLWPCGFKIEFM